MKTRDSLRNLLNGSHLITWAGLLLLGTITVSEIITFLNEGLQESTTEDLHGTILGVLLCLAVVFAFWFVPASLGAYVALLFFAFSNASQILLLVSSLVVFTALAASVESALVRRLYLGLTGAWMLQFTLRAGEDLIALVVLLPAVFLTYVATRSIFVLREKNQQSVKQMEVLRERTETAIRNERKNIARDLHDIVAHDITIVAMQSKAAKYADDEQASREALDVISKLSSETLHDLRLMLNVLRTDGSMSDIGGDGGAPAATTIQALHGVQVFSERLRDAGFEVRTEASEEIAELPRSAHTALYRVMQEATTNIIKHAQPSSVCSISLKRSGGNAVLRMVNQVPPRRTANEKDALWGGSGLIGMEDRMQAFGGHFEAGQQGQQWVLVADIPF